MFMALKKNYRTSNIEDALMAINRKLEKGRCGEPREKKAGIKFLVPALKQVEVSYFFAFAFFAGAFFAGAFFAGAFFAGAFFAGAFFAGAFFAGAFFAGAFFAGAFFATAFAATTSRPPLRVEKEWNIADESSLTMINDVSPVDEYESDCYL
jgi:uncharacterized protein YjbI with pentapeptide repeats